MNSPYALNKSNEHGYWMANTLKEIAPECKVYALNTAASRDEDKRVTAMIKAIDWSIKNHIDILTYSQEPISDKNRKRFDAAVNKAVKNNIITTFKDPFRLKTFERSNVIDIGKAAEYIKEKY